MSGVCCHIYGGLMGRQRTNYKTDVTPASSRFACVPPVPLPRTDEQSSHHHLHYIIVGQDRAHIRSLSLISSSFFFSFLLLSVLIEPIRISAVFCAGGATGTLWYSAATEMRPGTATYVNTSYKLSGPLGDATRQRLLRPMRFCTGDRARLNRGPGPDGSGAVPNWSRVYCLLFFLFFFFCCGVGGSDVRTVNWMPSTECKQLTKLILHGPATDVVARN